jgi:hypothetical protein
VERHRLCVYFLYLHGGYGKVLTLSVTRKATSSLVVRGRRSLLSQVHRLPLTGSRWDIRWLSGRGRTPTLCLFRVFSVAVMEKCCDARGDGEYYLLSGCLASYNANTLRLVLIGSRWDIRWLSGRGETPTLCFAFI